MNDSLPQCTVGDDGHEAIDGECRLQQTLNCSLTVTHSALLGVSVSDVICRHVIIMSQCHMSHSSLLVTNNVIIIKVGHPSL